MMDLERKLYNVGIGLSRAEFLLLLLLLTLLAGATAYYFDPHLLLLVPLVPVSVMVILDYVHRRKLALIESEMPRFIHYLSTHPSLTLTSLVDLGSKGFGELSREFSSMKTLVENGANPVRVLRAFYRRWGSPYLERVVEGILSAFRSGNVHIYLKNLSEELYFVQELENERKGALALQRYSILVSSFLLVPFILGTVTAVVKDLGIDTSVLSFVPPYLLMLSLIGGLYLSFSEGTPKNAPFYILLGALTSLVTYTVVAWLY